MFVICEKCQMPIANGLCGCNFKESYRSPAGYIAELERDAKRYRWLRERDLETISNGGVFAGITPDNHVLNGVDLDEAIDKAM